MQACLIPPTLRGYRRSWLWPDVLAGLALAAIAVPGQMATARLAGMPAVAGLYAFLAGSLLFAVLGRSRQMSVGADSTIAPVLAASAAAVAAAGTLRYAGLVSFLTLMAGGLLLAVGLLRLGWIAEFLSTPVVTGVLAGIGVEILVRQLPAILGVAGSGTTTVSRVQAIASQVGHANAWSAGIAAAVLAVIIVAEHVDRRIPGALIGLAGSILAVAVFGLRSRGVLVLGPVKAGLPSFAVPSASWADVRHLVTAALTVAFLCVAQTAATARQSKAGAPAAGDFNRDLAAVGAGSLAAGLIGSFAVDSSPPNTEIVTASGGRSQLTSVTAAAVVLGVTLLAAGLLKDLPQATLGAILVYVATKLFRAGELRSILRFDRLEFALAAITLLAVAFIGIEQGVVLAALLSLADRTRRSARPTDVILGREPGTEHWIPSDIGRPTEQVPGVIVYLPYGPLWYGNADYIRRRIRGLVDGADQPVRALVLDANAMSDIDYTAARALGELAAGLSRRGVTTGIARSSHLVHHDLKHSGLLREIGREHLFATVEAAVDALARET
ncbi:MAG: SulP family inorganic anion transporter [Actinomycetota bacterium]|nr:SulP family inorganic anion transporter [Actinomycetota bacterium]